jgi:hypothetical protein
MAVNVIGAPTPVPVVNWNDTGAGIGDEVCASCSPSTLT